jgi:hypothetical protein
MSNRLRHRAGGLESLPPTIVRTGGGGPHRIHIVIELRQAAPRRSFGSWHLLFWLMLALMLWAG